MTKKLLWIALFVLFILTGCAKEKMQNVEGEDMEEVITSSKSMTLTRDSDANQKIYKITLQSNSKNNQMTSNPAYPTTGQIVNEKDNYRFDIQIDDMTQAESDITIATEKQNSDWKEETFGNLKGYTYTDVVGTRTVRLIIDESNPEGRIFATLILDFEDSSNTNGMTLEELYQSSKVQYILHNVSFQVTKK